MVSFYRNRTLTRASHKLMCPNAWTSGELQNFWEVGFCEWAMKTVFWFYPKLSISWLAEMWTTMPRVPATAESFQLPCLPCCYGPCPQKLCFQINSPPLTYQGFLSPTPTRKVINTIVLQINLTPWWRAKSQVLWGQRQEENGPRSTQRATYWALADGLMVLGTEQAQGDLPKKI